MEKRGIVHLAGPAFAPEEVEGMSRTASLLEGAGFETYLEPRDGLGPALQTLAGFDGDPGGEGRCRSVLQSAAFALEVYQVVRRCDCVVFNMNGRVPDDGGAFLAAAAFGAGKPVVLYKRDHRSKLFGNDNAMITGLSFDFSTVGEPSRVPGAVADAMARRQEACRAPAGMPPLVGANVELGRRVWESLQRFRSRAPGAPGAEAEELYGELEAACRDSEAYRLRAAQGLRRADGRMT